MTPVPTTPETLDEAATEVVQFDSQTVHRAMETVAVKTKFQIVIPQRIRKQVGVDVGDILEARVEHGKITYTPKRLIDRDLAEGLEDLRHGRTHGPYASAREAIDALESRARSRAKKRRR